MLAHQSLETWFPKSATWGRGLAGYGLSLTRRQTLVLCLYPALPSALEPISCL